MSKKRQTRGGFLIWAGIILIVLALIADVLVMFTDNYLLYMLYTLPIWVLGLGAFALAGRNDRRLRKARK